MQGLTCNGISSIAGKKLQKYYLQILEPKKMRTANRITCYFSDGFYKMKGFISETQKLKEGSNLLK